MTPPQTLAAMHVPSRSVESVLASRWARLFLPSLSDLFFVAILVWLFMSSGWAGWQGLLVDGDIGWHIRTGQFILTNHAVPHHDLYSFSKPDAPWYAWEWASDILAAGLYQLAGLKGIVLTAGVVIAAFATTLIRRMAWRGVHCLIGMLVALLGVGASSMHFLARPHIVTMLLLSVSVWVIEADRREPSRRIWWLVPLTVVWTNLHGGFLVLIATLGVAALGAGIEAWLGRNDWRNAARYVGLTAACSAASLINPYGYQLHIHVVEYLRSDWIRNVIQEFQSPSFRNENMMQFEALMLVGLIATASFLRRRQIVEALWIIFFVHLALGSVRHVPMFVTVTAPLIAAELSDWWKLWTADAGKGSFPRIINQMAADTGAGFLRSSAWPAIVVGALALTGPPIPWPKDFPSLIFPTEMVHAHAAQILNSRVFTTDQWADYLIFTNPRQKVFVDGRSDFYGEQVGNQYLHALTGQPDWKQVFDKYGFNLALLPVDTAIAQLLRQSPDWSVVERDDKHILLIRRAISSADAVPSTSHRRP